MKISVPDFLTINGGYTDTAGFLALQGLFTAHVTGNFVTLGASLVNHTPGALPKLLALPVFCVGVALARLFSNTFSHKDASVFNTLVAVKVGLFVLAAILAVTFGPFLNTCDTAAALTGMALVCGMAIQNAVHRIFFAKTPPTTLMTGSTTQIMMDLTDLMEGGLSPDNHSAACARCMTLLRSVACFAFGCASAALVYAIAGRFVLIGPPVISAVAFIPHLHSAGIPARRQIPA